LAALNTAYRDTGVAAIGGMFPRPLKRSTRKSVMTREKKLSDEVPMSLSASTYP
jgi:hypothetical protein